MMILSLVETLDVTRISSLIRTMFPSWIGNPNLIRILNFSAVLPSFSLYNVYIIVKHVKNDITRRITY